MPNILLVFSQNHFEFRLPEFESICRMFDIALNENKNVFKEKYLHALNFCSIEDVKKLLSRSVLLKGAYEVYAEATTHENLITEMSLKRKIFDQFNNSCFTWALRFISHGTKRTNEYRVELMEKYAEFMELDESPIDLKHPLNEFCVIEENDGESVTRIYFCRLILFKKSILKCKEINGIAFSIGEGQGALKVRYNIKERKYIGNSTMDPELSFLQANLAHCCQNSFVLDPFCGTGGLLLAASHFGALSIGVEINYLVARAVGKSSRTGETLLSNDQSIRANFQQYNLEDKFVGVLLADSSQKDIWHLNELACNNGLFDAIITDPPYGIREKGQKVGLKSINYERNEPSESVCRLPPKTKYSISNVYLDLLNLATKLLRVGGRLCFWFPVIRNEYTENVLPQHECLERLYNCEQVLSKEASRRLLVYEKVNNDVNASAYFEENCYESESYRKKIFRNADP